MFRRRYDAPPLDSPGRSRKRTSRSKSFKSKPRRSSFTSSSRPSSSPGRSRFSQRESPGLFLKLFDIGIYVGLVAVLMAFAGRTPTGQLLLLISTGVVGICWSLHRLTSPSRPWRWTGFEFIFLAVAGLGVLQLTFLPVEQLSSLSPRAAYFLGEDLFPESISHLEQPDWHFLSLVPEATRLTLIPILCILLQFLLLTQRFTDREHALRVMKTVSLGVAGYSCFAIVQLLAGNGKFFGIIEHPFTSTGIYTKGSFTNSNHFSGFLAMSLGPLLAWMITRSDDKKSRKRTTGWHQPSQGPDLRIVTGGIAVIAVLIGIALSGSRGGFVLASVAMVVTLLLVLIRRAADSRLPFLLSVCVLIGLVGISVMGGEFFERNVQQLATADMEVLDSGNARRFIWEANLQAQKDFRWFGTGLGSHREVIPAYHPKELDGRVFTHAENSYLQIGTENGLCGWILTGLAVLLVLRKLLQVHRNPDSSMRERAFQIGITGTFVVFLVHGTYDFGWYAPAYMMLLAIYLAYLFGDQAETGGIAKSPGEDRPRRLGAVLVGGCAVLLLWLGGPVIWPAAQAEPHTMTYLRYTRRGGNFDSPDDEMAMLKVRINALRKALRIYPEHSENNRRMAGCLQRAFQLRELHNSGSMPISQIRAAAYSGGFDSPETLQQWLAQEGVMKETLPVVRACLEYARRSTLLCPVQTEALLIQSQYCFTESPDQSLAEYFLARGERAQPNSSQVLFTRGFDAWNRGDVESAIETWKPIFQRQNSNQKRILTLLAPAFPPEQIVQLLDLDLDTMQRLVKVYEESDPAAYQQISLVYAETVLSQLNQNLTRYQQRLINFAFHHLANSDLRREVIVLTRKVAAQYPESVELRRKFGLWLSRHGEETEAVPHLEFCHERLPADQAVLKALQTSRTKVDQLATDGLRTGGTTIRR